MNIRLMNMTGGIKTTSAGRAGIRPSTGSGWPEALEGRNLPPGSLPAGAGQVRNGFSLIELPFDKLPSGLSLRVEDRVVRKRKSRAFTLIELLVVIIIIVLLLGILAPSIGRIRKLAKTEASQARIALIDTGCEMFHEDFDFYPPSSSGSGAPYGKELIALYMTGYANDPDGNSMPEADLSADDGKDGFGFRTVKRGKVYGPYNGTEKIPTNNRIFIDTFDNEIFYYRWDDNGVGYDEDHNSDDTPDQAYLDGCANYRKSFLLLSKGDNEKWGIKKAGSWGKFPGKNPPPEEDDSLKYFDDIKNFKILKLE